MSLYPDDKESKDPTWRPDVDGIVELGSGHFLAPVYHEGRVSYFHEWHMSCTTGEWHPGSLALQYPDEPKKSGVTWNVDSMDPVSLSPSVACSCGVHGFIRFGRWVDA